MFDDALFDTLCRLDGPPSVGLSAGYRGGISNVSGWHFRNNLSSALIFINHSLHVVTAISSNDYHQLFSFLISSDFKKRFLSVLRQLTANAGDR
jgi:hypothetical protein